MAKKANPLGYEFNKGVWAENPVLAALLGLCPVLAVTNTAENGLAMGLATSFVLISSSFMVAMLRKVIPKQVRIAGYIVIIATFVTMADRFLSAYFFEISKSLGPYIPLIVVNCLILGRQEAFSSKNSIFRSLVDAIGMSVGFTWVLVILGGIREIFGSGSLFNIVLFGDWFEPWMVMILPPGAFFTLGFMIAAYNLKNMRGA